MTHKISCDEAGFTGSNLLDTDQPYFVYASTDLTDEEASQLIAELREKYKIGGNELKGSTIWGNSYGQKFAMEFYQRMEGRYRLSAHNKRFVMATKVFEYIFEPVVEENNMVFYKHHFHQFISNLLYLWGMLDKTSPAFQLLEDMRGWVKDPKSYNVSKYKSDDVIINLVIQFAHGYRKRIVENFTDILNIPNLSRYLLETSSASLFTHLRYWGQIHDQIEVVCDTSKPLIEIEDFLNAMVDRTDAQFIELHGKRQPLTWNMKGKVTFSQSHVTPGIQIADLCASLMCAALKNPKQGAAFLEQVEKHLINVIGPDLSYVDLDKVMPKVNYLILLELAERASKGANPLEGIEEIYHEALASAPFYDFKGLNSNAVSAA